MGNYIIRPYGRSLADLALEGLNCESFCSLVNDFGSGLDSLVCFFLGQMVWILTIEDEIEVPV